MHDAHPPKWITLDMDSSVSPIHGDQEGGDQEGTAWNGHFGCIGLGDGVHAEFFACFGYGTGLVPMAADLKTVAWISNVLQESDRQIPM